MTIQHQDSLQLSPTIGSFLPQRINLRFSCQCISSEVVEELDPGQIIQCQSSIFPTSVKGALGLVLEFLRWFLYSVGILHRPCRFWFSVGLGWGLRLHISNKLSGDTTAASLRNTLWGTRYLPCYRGKNLNDFLGIFLVLVPKILCSTSCERSQFWANQDGWSLHRVNLQPSQKLIPCLLGELTQQWGDWGWTTAERTADCCGLLLPLVGCSWSRAGQGQAINWELEDLASSFGSATN